MSDIKYFLVRYLWFLFPLKFFLFLFSPFPFSFYAVIRLAYFPSHPFPSGRGPLYCFMKLSQFPVCSTPPSFVLPPPPPPTNATYQHQYHHLPTPRTNTTNTHQHHHHSPTPSQLSLYSTPSLSSLSSSLSSSSVSFPPFLPLQLSSISHFRLLFFSHSPKRTTNFIRNVK